MTVYTFWGDTRHAADLLYHRTSLGFSPYIRAWPVNYDPEEPTVVFSFKDDATYSSGEEVLLDLLGSISGRTSAFAVSDMGKLDAETRRVAWEAIGIAAGIEGIKVTQP